MIHKKKNPAWVPPMLATLSKGELPEKGWVLEKKFDGMRCLVFYENEEVLLYSRNKKKNNESFPEIADAAKKIAKKSFIADGEIVAFKGKVSSFSKLQNRIGLRLEKKTEQQPEVFLYLFDLLFYDGEDLRKKSLRERKKTLKEKFKFSQLIRFTTHRSSRLQAFYEEMCKSGEEGVIAKKIGSRYESNKRAKTWLKFKCGNQQELVIGGFTEPKGSRAGFGAILIGYYEGNHLKYAGKVGTGFSDSLLKQLKKKFDKIKQKQSPFENYREKEHPHWIKPKLVAEIGFAEWTRDGKLRQPKFLGLREDKNPKEVVRENKSWQKN